MTKVLIDTNVCLDAALKRKPFANNATKFLALSEKGTYSGLVASHSFDTIFYFLRQKYSHSTSYKAMQGLTKAVNVADVTEKVVQAAIHLEWKDFEDAIHYETAKASECQTIITRNGNDFSASELPVYSLRDFLDKLDGI